VLGVVGKLVKYVVHLSKERIEFFFNFFSQKLPKQQTTRFCITFLNNVGVLLPFQESRAVNRKNTHTLVFSLTQIEFKSFPGIVKRYFLVFANVAFYKTGSILLVQECYMISRNFRG
jgi:hypothetical protein